MILTGPQLLDRVRRYVDDSVEPFNFPSDLLYELLTEAEREIALVGKLLRQTITQTIAADARWLNLQDYPEIIELRTAVLVDSNNRRYPLQLRGTMDSVDAVYPQDDYGLIINNTDSLTPGRPKALFFGKKTNVVEISPVSDGAYTIEMTTIVYPEDPITASTTEPTIPERHHPALAIGAAARALEFDPFFDDNSRKLQTINAAWQQALVRAMQETGRISRDAGTVQFTNSYW